MIITIKNFGPIKEFEFDTNTDFMLMVGENNVGKSYAVSVVYLVFKKLSQPVNDSSILMQLEYFTPVARKLRHHVAGRVRPSNITEFVNDLILEVFNLLIVGDLKQSIENTFDSFSSLTNRFSHEPTQILVRYQDFEVNFEINAGLFFITSLHAFDRATIEKEDDSNGRDDRYTLRIEGDVFSFSSGDELTCLRFIATCFFRKFSGLFGDLGGFYFLPASRSGLSMGLSSLGPVMAQLSGSRGLITQPLLLPTIPVPHSDYYLAITTIKQKTADSLYAKYAQEIETEVLKGTVSFDFEKKRLMFLPHNTDLKLDLSATSSMVSELSPVVAYLKYILDRPDKQEKSSKPFIFLEEPEAHIHPANQIKLIKILAKLVKDGKIKLIITSHSNYLFNQCSNLVMDGSIDKDSFRAVLLKATELGSEAVDLDVNNFGIEDSNFVDVAEELFEEKLNLLEKTNATIRANQKS